MNKNSVLRHIKFVSVTLTIFIHILLFSEPYGVKAEPTNDSKFQSQSSKTIKIKQLGNRGLPSGRRRGGTNR